MSPDPDAALAEVPVGDAEVRFGYVLKHAHLRCTELTGAALAPLGVTTIEWAALLRFGDERQLSQAEVARSLGIDRTSMVAMIDDLEGRGLVQRRPHPADRRKNVVELTAKGRKVERAASKVVDRCQAEFLAPLSDRQVEDLTRALLTISGLDPA